MARYLLLGWISIIVNLGYGPECGAADRALLVGVSRYPNLAAKSNLDGTANDVTLIESVLAQRLSETNGTRVKILSEASGAGRPSHLPTRANIQLAFRKLTESTNPGDNVVVFISGHGSQQPTQKDSPFPEPDGLDEIFLPRDVEKWDGKGKRVAVPNAITDDEFAGWFAAIRAKGARLFVIFDCCHAGHMTRSVGEVERSVSAELLGMPNVQSRRPVDERQLPVDIAQDGMAILYACDSFQKAIELPLPNSKGKQHGLLTWSLASVLSQTDQSLSYRELTRRIHNEYVKQGRQQGPTPIIEGGDIDREVLGLATMKRASITITEDEPRGTLHIAAGQLHGLSSGSVLSVFSPTEKLIGHVKVRKAELDQSEVEVVAFGAVPKPSTTDVIGGRCEIALTNQLGFKLKLGIDETAMTSNLAPTLDRVLDEVAADVTSVVERVSSPSESEWLLTVESNDVFLTPTHDVLVPGQDFSATRFGPFPADSKLDEKIRTAAFRISRARNLLKIAAGQGNAIDAYDGVSMEIETRLFESADDLTGKIVPPSFRVNPGNRIQHQVTNIGSEPFDLTVLEINSQLKITAVFPTGGRRNRFQPDDGPRTLPRLVVTDSTFGSEYFVFLAVKAAGPRSDFTSLEQPAVSVSRSSTRGSTCLTSLLEAAMYGVGKPTRATREDVGTYQFLTVPMTVLPGE